MRTITRDIVEDLLPLYAAGEASADTRAVVEEWLRADPELARLVAALRQDAEPRPVVAVTPESGVAALATTKSLLRRRTWLFAFALFFSGLPLSFLIDDSGELRFLMFRDAPLASVACGVAAVALWASFGAIVRRLRVTGL